MSNSMTQKEMDAWIAGYKSVLGISDHWQNMETILSMTTMPEYQKGVTDGKAELKRRSMVKLLKGNK